MRRKSLYLTAVTGLTALALWSVYGILKFERCPSIKEVALEDSAFDGKSWTIKMNIQKGNLLSFKETNNRTLTSRNLGQSLLVNNQTCKIKVSLKSIEGRHFNREECVKIFATIRTYDTHGNELDLLHEEIGNPVYPAEYTAIIKDSSSDSKSVELFNWKRQWPNGKMEFLSIRLCIE